MEHVVIFVYIYKNSVSNSVMLEGYVWFL